MIKPNQNIFKYVIAGAKIKPSETLFIDDLEINVTAARKSGIKGFTSLYFNMDSLITLGTLISYLTGIASLIFSIQDYSGVSAMIMAFFITGKFYNEWVGAELCKTKYCAELHHVRSGYDQRKWR
jgi:hypothetical protein